jgi:hypothetical protein
MSSWWKLHLHVIMMKTKRSQTQTPSRFIKNPNSKLIDNVPDNFYISPFLLQVGIGVFTKYLLIYAFLILQLPSSNTQLSHH